MSDNKTIQEIIATATSTTSTCVDAEGSCNKLVIVKNEGNKFGDKGAKALADALKEKLPKKYLDKYIDEDGNGQIEINATDIQKIILPGNEIGVNGIRALEEIINISKELNKLDLSNNKLGDDGTIALVEALGVGCYDIKQTGCEEKTVEELKMADDDAWPGYSHLKKLDLRNNEIGVEGAKAIKQLIAYRLWRKGGNKSIDEIDLSNNNIGDNGAIAIAEVLKKNETLENINLSHNNIGDKGKNALTGALKFNHVNAKLKVSQIKLKVSQQNFKEFDNSWKQKLKF